MVAVTVGDGGGYRWTVAKAVVGGDGGGRSSGGRGRWWQVEKNRQFDLLMSVVPAISFRFGLLRERFAAQRRVDWLPSPPSPPHVPRVRKRVRVKWLTGFNFKPFSDQRWSREGSLTGRDCSKGEWTLRCFSPRV